MLFDYSYLKMEKVEVDLDRSRQLREKQAQEFHKQTEDEKRRHLQEVSRTLLEDLLSRTITIKLNSLVLK